MKNNMKFLAILLLSALGLNSCDSSERSGSSEAVGATEEEAAVVQAPNFNPDSAYYFVEKQVAFGPRVPNTAEHYKTGEWLIETLRGYGAEVQVQSFQARAFDGKMLNLRNIIATINPNATKRVLLAAHWDTRPFADKDTKDQNKPIDGANDGASGVGVLLEIARTIHTAQQKPGIGVDIILFDGEDYGQPDESEFPYQNDSWCLGSQYWSKNKHVPNYKAHYGILLDMVGAENAKFAREGNSMQYARNIVDKVWRAGNKIGYSDYFKYVNAPAITDDHYYVNTVGGIRMIDIIEYNMADPDDYFGPYHHRHTDTMDVISKTTLKAVGQTVLHVLYNE
ncbi:M28 family peptidase [Pontibacter sp. JH31]|uniref:M28 family peptidase n=1 Tax=Pontibacter aquaedesilientis TaxID=2766980 RepID=A0ABR7XF55_9BACT|nr:M28 family peptidase [Pontibacter aquaedesilientis]MBD1396556.1 M28 family peptidase [Pontibacter aquaedesilientis]